MQRIQNTTDLPLGRHFNVITKYYVGALTKRLENTGLDRHYSLLMTIDSVKSSCTQQVLCDFLHIDKAVMVRNIDFLAQKQLIKRVPGVTDRREHNIVLTPKGTKILQHIKKAVSELNKLAFKGISVAKQKEFYALLDLMNDNLKQQPSNKVILNYKSLGGKKLK